MESEIAGICINPESSIRDAIACIDSTRHGIVLVVDVDRRLVGTVTDGDVRRALLANIDLAQPVAVLLGRKTGSRYAQPITARIGAGGAVYLNVLRQNSILHLPIVDDDQRVVGLVTLDEFVPTPILPLQALIMAGGKGSRLRPLTEEVPKPMLLVGDRPLMEIIIQQLRDAGIKRVHVTTHHKSEKITKYFGDGRNFGVEMTYVAEDRPLGTAGALGLMGVPQQTLLVINGDILTQVDFHAMLAFHREHQSDLTMAVRKYDIQVPFGVVECDGASVLRLTEKPLLNFFVNAGIYLLEPVVYQYFPNGKRFDMTDLIQRLLEERRRVVSFPVREYWLDIGQVEDYKQALADVKSGKV